MLGTTDNINEEDIETSVQDSNGEQPSPGEDEVQGNAEREVISLLSRGHSVKRKGTKMDKRNKRIRIDQSIREAPAESMYEGNEVTNAKKDDNTNDGDSNSKDLDYEMEHSNENGINCVIVENYSHQLDQNEGNIAYLIENHTTNKKPISDRTNVNWGPSQTQRGKTTFYPCSGYFRCSNCEQKFTEDGKCSDCKIALTKSACNAKKYIYFCENACIREVFKKCCEERRNPRKLIILYINKHECISRNNLKKQASNKFRNVETKEDLIKNIETSLKKDTEHFLIVQDKVPSDIDGNRYIVIENIDKKELKDIIRDGRKWQTFVQTSSKVLCDILGEKTSKNVRKYKCSDQYFCFNETCPFKKRFELLNQVDWKIEDGTRRCTACSEIMEKIQCEAEKIVVRSENWRFVLIKHRGNHKCISKTTLETAVLEEMELYFEKNPTATRSEAIVNHLVNKINFGSAKDVTELVSISLNIWEINNCKQKGLKRLNPHGNNLEAIRHFVKKIQDIGNPYDVIMHVFDDVYICDVCNYTSEGKTEDCVKFCAMCSMNPMQNIGPSVFISCKDSLTTLRELSPGRSLETEAVCLDHQPSRLRQFTTFAAYAYDLDLRRMSPLFSSVMTNEKELAVYHTLGKPT